MSQPACVACEDARPGRLSGACDSHWCHAPHLCFRGKKGGKKGGKGGKKGGKKGKKGGKKTLLALQNTKVCGGCNVHCVDGSD